MKCGLKIQVTSQYDHKYSIFEGKGNSKNVVKSEHKDKALGTFGFVMC